MTDKPTPKLTTAATAARLLADILAWKWQEWTPVEHVRSTRYDRDLVQGSNGDTRLPFGLDSIIDCVDSDGANGIVDNASVDKWLRYWTPWMQTWAGLPTAYIDQPGPLFLQQLEENRNFDHIDTWDEQDQTAWADFTAELHIVHARVANATGHAPRTRGTCPKCKKGTLQQHAGQDGYSDTAECTNCHAVIDYSREETAASIRAIMRGYDGTDLYLPLHQIRLIWPNLKACTLRKWVQRGHVHTLPNTTPTRYWLRDVNTRMWGR